MKKVRTIASAEKISMTDNEQLKLVVGACAVMGVMVALIIIALVHLV